MAEYTTPGAPDRDREAQNSCPVCGTACIVSTSREGTGCVIRVVGPSDLEWRVTEMKLLLQEWLRAISPAECERLGLLALRIRSTALAWGIGESTADWQVRQVEMKLGRATAPYSDDWEVVEHG